MTSFISELRIEPSLLGEITMEMNMRNFIASAFVAASAALATAAIAANLSATGVITNVDAKGDAIALDDGKIYVLSEGVEAETLKAGEKVTVVFHVKSGKMIATSVKMVK
jgi:Cu/Ag efflux protein CusF